MKKLITGGVGHIGTNICLEAIRRGHEVVAMDNLHRKEVINNLRYLETIKGFEFIWGDVRNVDDFDRIPQVDAIIHLAANPGIPWSIEYPTYDFETNARGTLNTLEFARKCGNVPFVYASTNKTFSDIINRIPLRKITKKREEEVKRYQWGIWMGNDSETTSCINGIDFEKSAGTLFPEAINENFPVMGFGEYGHSMYGISKLTGELYATEYHCQYGLPVVINKMSCIFGLFQAGAVEQGWISHFVKSILKGDPITFFGTGKQVRDVLDARDVARLYIDEIEKIGKANGEVFTVGGGVDNTLSLIEACDEIEKQTGKKFEIKYEDKRPADQDIYVSSLTHVKEVMGWEPGIRYQETIGDMIEEYTK